MKTLVFLQNMWLRNPEKYRASMERAPLYALRMGIDAEQYRKKLRARTITYSLFAGCPTGRRLKRAFGEALCDEIIWEEASLEVGSTAKSFFPANPEHMSQVLTEQDPDVVVCLSAPAKETLKKLISGVIVFGPHPACRKADTQPVLDAIGVLLRAWRQRWGQDWDGFYHPAHNRRGMDRQTETVGYHCGHNERGEYRITNACHGKDLTGWQTSYVKAMEVLQRGEKLQWRVP